MPKDNYKKENSNNNTVSINMIESILNNFDDKYKKKVLRYFHKSIRLLRKKIKGGR